MGNIQGFDVFKLFAGHMKQVMGMNHLEICWKTNHVSKESQLTSWPQPSKASRAIPIPIKQGKKKAIIQNHLVLPLVWNLLEREGPQVRPYSIMLKALRNTTLPTTLKPLAPSRWRIWIACHWAIRPHWTTKCLHLSKRTQDVWFHHPSL